MSRGILGDVAVGLARRGFKESVMKVVVVVTAVLSAVALFAGWMIGWVLPLIKGRTAAFGLERANASIEISSRFGEKPIPAALDWLAAATAWTNVAHILLVMGGLLAALAVVGVVLLAKGKKVAV